MMVKIPIIYTVELGCQQQNESAWTLKFSAKIFSTFFICKSSFGLYPVNGESDFLTGKKYDLYLKYDLY